MTHTGRYSSYRTKAPCSNIQINWSRDNLKIQGKKCVHAAVDKLAC